MLHMCNHVGQFPFPFRPIVEVREDTACLVAVKGSTFTFTFTFMHLADAFYPKRLTIAFMLYIFCQYMCSSGNRTHNLCAANAML